MFIIKSGGGANKVLIDNKPPMSRLNLTEVESVIRNRVVGFGGFQIMARQNNEYYITASRESAILKGNPYTNWTQILSFKDITMDGNIRAVMYNIEDDSLTFVAIHQASIYIYKSKNGLLTLEKALSLNGNIVNLFILKNTVYFHTVYNGTNYLIKHEIGTETLTDITKNLIFEDGTKLEFIGSFYGGSTYKDKRYQTRFSTNSKKVQIIEFDGEKIRIAKEIETEFGIYAVYPEQCLGSNSDEIYFTILSDDISTDFAIKRKYKLIDKEFNIIKEGESIYPLGSSFVINNTYITKETSDNKDNTMVEFPVKAYVRRE